MNKIISYYSRNRRGFMSIISIFMVLILLSTGCSTIFSPQTTAEVSTPTPGGTPEATPTPPEPEAVVNFNVEIPMSKVGSESVFIDILDEVTGLALNPTRYRMNTIDSRHFSIQLPIKLGEVVKYRYVRDGDIPAIEYSTTGQQVRYRMLNVTAPTEVQDIISAWIDTPYTGPAGRITGQVIDSITNSPVPDALISAGGLQSLTSSDGSYVLEGLPPGVHNLVVITLDGAYNVFQQGARIETGSSTPAMVKLTPAKMVSITFIATIPHEILGVPVRLAGDLYSLGNTFADLSGGMSTIASRMPVMTPLSDGRQSLTLTLPAGTDLHYKYTIGDGFWDAEHSSDGNFVVRDIIVPDQDTTIDDTVQTWASGQQPAITFTVTVPTDTPSEDYVSIQFNPYGWTEPVPMWSIGENKWMYVLFSPFNLIDSFSYRYCRNDQCGVADDAATQGSAATGWQVKVQEIPQSFNDVVSQWSMLQPQSHVNNNLIEVITPRDSSFVAGIEFQANYQPTWQSLYLSDFQELHNMGDRWVFFSPTWSYLSSQTPVFSPVPGKDALWNDLEQTIIQARSSGIEMAIYPQPSFSTLADQWWQSAPRDFSWWVAWFDSYRTFLLNFADLCTQSKASALVIGGEWIAPALPEGKLADGSPSGVPWDAETRWENLISDVKAHYSGPLIWAMPFSSDTLAAPKFVESFDQVYVLFSASLSNSTNPTIDELETSLIDLVDNVLAPWQEQLGKPMILGVSYPSAVGSASDCISLSSSDCVPNGSINQAGPLSSSQKSVIIDLQAQSDIYEAFMAVVYPRAWISGFVSRGFFPPVEIQDGSSSINGKPAFDVLKYWFSRLND